jgi:ABC-2 type transport system ATP-binding protein
MEEADRLADDIVVIDRGRKIAQGTADQLKTEIGGERIELVLADAADIPGGRSILSSLAIGEIQVDEQARRVTAAVTGGVDALKRVLDEVTERSVHVVDVGLRRPTLDDVFLSLTGHSAEEAADDGEPQADATPEIREKEAAR